MAHRVAAWESMPWEAVEAVAVPSVEKGRATCAASYDTQELRHARLRRYNTSARPPVIAKVDSPPLVESRPVTGP